MKIIRINLLVVLFASLLFNCGSKEEKKKEGFSYEKTGTSETSDTKTAEANEANIVITSNDLMQYNIKEIKVKIGDRISEGSLMLVIEPVAGAAAAEAPAEIKPEIKEETK